MIKESWILFSRIPHEVQFRIIIDLIHVSLNWNIDGTMNGSLPVPRQTVN